MDSKEHTATLILLFDRPTFYFEIAVAIINIIRYSGIIYFLFFFNLPIDDKLVYIIYLLIKKDFIFNFINVLKKIHHYRHKNTIVSSISLDVKEQHNLSFTGKSLIYIFIIETLFLFLALSISLFVIGETNKINIYLLSIIYFGTYLIDNTVNYLILAGIFAY